MSHDDAATGSRASARVRRAPATRAGGKKPRRHPPAAVPAEPAAKDKAMDDTMQTATDKTAAMFAGAADRTKGAMEKGQAMVEEMSAFGKGNIEALVESSKIAARGFETLGQDAAAYAKKSMEEATAAARTLAGVKSPMEFMKLQGDFVRQSFDTLVAQSSRQTEAMLKLAGEVAQPISNRVALAADKVKVGA
jgi:phasin family protein